MVVAVPDNMSQVTDDGNVLYLKHTNVNILMVVCIIVLQDVTIRRKWVKDTRSLLFNNCKRIYNSLKIKIRGFF